MGGSREEGRGLGGGILANVERGPIKVKAMGNMNDLRLKHTQGHTHTHIYVKHTSIECNVRLSVTVTTRVTER